MALRILIAEDSFVVREGLAQLLASEPTVEVVGVCEDKHSLVEAIERERPDVVLSDIRMPPLRGAEGIEVAAQLRETHPEIGVVILSQYSEPGFALQLFESGSEQRAYLLKERVGSRKEIVGAVHAVADGRSVVDPKIVDELIAERARSTESRLSDLTAREREVLAEVATGKSNMAIAETLFLTKRAVEKHINAIFLKLSLREADDVSRRVKAALMFLADERRLVPDDGPAEDAH
ncbi:MAG TPA: response regulator transcription factor [Thermoleophilaceae bacterium]|nr:response regulator transcription factor [Thermoleophilaceae bacterium]